MARITLEEIAQVLAEENWKVLSTDYQNLDTEMEFMCAEGHKVFAPWKKIRTKRECPVCKQNRLKENKPNKKEKNKKENRVLALDQATHNTGWSVFDGNKLIKYGIFEATAKEDVERFHQVKEWLLSMIENFINKNGNFLSECCIVPFVHLISPSSVIFTPFLYVGQPLVHLISKPFL